MMVHRRTRQRVGAIRAGLLAGGTAAALLAAPGSGGAAPADPAAAVRIAAPAPYAFGHQAGRLRVQSAGRTGPARATEESTGAPAAAARRPAGTTYPVSFTVPPLPGAESKLLYVWNRADWASGVPVDDPDDSRFGHADLPVGDYFAVALLLTWDDSPYSLLARPFTVTRRGARVTFSDRTVEARVALDDPAARRSDGTFWISVPGGDLAGIGSGVRPVRVTPFTVPGVSLRMHEVLTAGDRRYDIFHEFAGGAPAQPVARVATDGLARTATTIRSQGGGPTGGALLSWPDTGDRAAAPLRSDVAVPGTVTEYVTPGQAFDRAVDIGASQLTFDLGRRTLTPGANPDETVGAAPVAPRRIEWGTATRNGDTIDVREHAGFDDAAGHLGTDQGVRLTARLTSGGRTLAAADDAAPNEPLHAVVEPAPATYELTHTLTRQAPWSLFSTQVHTEWVFRSEHTAYSTNLPLIQLDPQVAGLDPGNAAGPDPVRITATTQVRGEDIEAAVTAIEYSVDDGATWRSLPVTDASAQLDVPASAAYVSLRVTAADQQGDSVRRTVLRAFAGPAR